MWTTTTPQWSSNASRVGSGAIVACFFLTAALACSRGGTPEIGDVDAFSALTAVEDLRIGDVDDPDLGFSRIGGVDVDRDGQVFVYEVLDRQIRVYDSEGRPVRRIGRAGEGPGEFAGVGRLGVVGDTVWVYDNGLRRLTLFDRAGTVLSTATIHGVFVAMPNPGVMGRVTPRAMRPDGLFTSDMTGFSFTHAMDGTGTWTDTVMMPRVLFDAAGNAVDTAGWFAYPPSPPGGLRHVELRGTRYTVPRPPRDEELRVMMDDGGYYIGRPQPASPEPAGFTVTRIAESGDTIFRKQFRYFPVRYTEAFLDTTAWQSARIPGGSYNPDTGPAPTPEGVDINVVQRTIREAMDWPEFQLPVESAQAGDDGTLWLRRSDDGGPALRYLVLDGDGFARGVLAVPRRFQVRWISSDEFWAVDADELGVPWLVRFRYDTP